MKWIETTLRKGTKTPKICRDMFITDSHGEFSLCIVKNGRMFSREKITLGQASRLQQRHKLKSAGSCFNGCYTLRTQESNALIASIINS